MTGLTLSAGSVTVPLVNLESPPSACKARVVRLQHPAVIPAYSQLVVPAQVSGESTQLTAGSWVMEPRQSILNKHALAMAATLAEVQSGLVPVRFLNLTSEPTVLPAQTIVGDLLPCSVIDEAPALDTNDNGEEVPCHFTKSNAEEEVQPQGLFQLGHLKPTEQQRVELLLRQYSCVVSSGPTDLGKTDIVQHSIPTITDQPVRQGPRRIPLHLRSEVKDHVDGLLDAGIVKPSQSPWAAPIVTVRKPDKSLRLCVDYRRLNGITVKDAFPLPRVQDAIDVMAGARYFSTIDLCSGYWQVELDTAARAKAAFITPFGLYEWQCMPFGLCNAPGTFQRLMNCVLDGLIYSSCMVYLDDIIVYSHSFDEHLTRLAEVFDRLHAAGLKIKPSKCHLFQDSVVYLGHRLSHEGVSPDPSKFSAVQDWPTPCSVSDVRRFVGFASYYRRFIPQFSAIATPLHALTKKHATFSWNDKCDEAFVMLKTLLTSSPVLGYPDPNFRFVLDTDASAVGMGAVLSQQIGNRKERVIAYASKSLSQSQQNYSVSKRELLAVVHFCDHFRHYLLGAEFTLRTDHKALVWLHTFDGSSRTICPLD